MVLVLDTESTTKNTGHPFTKTNKLVLVGLGNDIFKIEYDNEPYGENLTKIQSLIDGASLLVGFNLKHDLHWLRRYGIKFDKVRVWDVQLAYFILKAQSKPYPSLDEVSLRPATDARR